MENQKFSTAFASDFSIADVFGERAVRGTFRRAFAEWKSNYKYLTDLVIVLNHKIWQHYRSNESLARVYDELWRKADSYAVKHLKGDELAYFCRTTD